jgi:hypothetical protein
MRVSITSGSRRDTTTSGFFFGISLVVPPRLCCVAAAYLRLRYDLRRMAAADEKRPASFAGFNRVLTAVSDKTNTSPRRTHSTS